MDNLLNAITHFGWLAVMLVLFAESGMLVGFFLPGDSLLFVAGTLIQQDIFKVNIVVVIICFFLASALGNSLGYYLGKRYGRKLFKKKNARFLREDYLHQAEIFYEKYGPRAVLLAMFIPVVRAFASFVAGLSAMPYRKFLTFNLIGVGVWVVGFTMLGYAVGDTIKRLGINVEVAALIVIFLTTLPGIIHVLQKPEHRARLKHHTKQFLRLK